MAKLDPILKDYLDEMVFKYQRPEFIESDPIQIPKKYQFIYDIEIAGFLTATISWGNRASIINNAEKMLSIMGESPYDFVMNFSENDKKKFEHFKHRTFNQNDLIYFISSLKSIYQEKDGFSNIFVKNQTDHELQNAISEFKRIFFLQTHEKRIEKHVADPKTGSAAKRINMMLRWFVRKDPHGVDIGIWSDKIATSKLSCPLDVHSGRVARALGLLNRNQNDQRALEELDGNLRILDPIDPVKYDFALFGLGVFEQFT